MEKPRGIELLLSELDVILMEKEKQVMVLAAEIRFIKDWHIRVRVLRNEIDYEKEHEKNEVR